MANDPFQPILSEPGPPITAPVYNPGPNPLDAILRTATATVDQFASDRDKATAAKRQKKKDAEEAAKTDASRELFNKLYGVERGLQANGKSLFGVPNQVPSPSPDPATATSPQSSPDAVIQSHVDAGTVTQDEVDQVHAAVGEQVRTIETTQAAVNQGTLNPLALKAVVGDAIQEILATHPTVSPDILYASLEKMGIKNTGFAEISREYADRTHRDAADRELYDKMVDAGRSSLPFELQNAPEYQDPNVLATLGQDILLQDAQVERLGKQATLQGQQIANTKASKEMDDSQRIEEASNLITQGIYSKFAPILNTFPDLFASLGEPGSNPAAEAKLQEYEQVLTAAIPQIIESSLSKWATQIPGKSRDELRTEFQKVFENSILAPLRTRESGMGKILKTMQDNLGVKAVIAMPLLAQLKSAGVNLDFAEIAMASLDQNEREQLGKELIGLTNDPVKGLTESTAKAWLGKMMALAQGDSTLNNLNLSPPEARKAFRTIRAMNGTTAAAIQEGKATDAQVDTYRNTQMEIAVQAGQISPGSDGLIQANGILSLAGSDVSGKWNYTRKTLGALIAKGDEEASIAGTATRASMAKLVISLARSPSIGNNQGYSVYFDKEAGVFKLKAPSNKPGAAQRAFGITKDYPTPPPPRELTKIASALNTGIDFLVKTGEWESDAPKGTTVELRKFYANGTPTRDMLAQAQKAKKDGNTVSKSMKAFDKVIADIRGGNFTIDVPEIAGSGGVGIDAHGNAVLPEAAKRMSQAASSAGLNPIVTAGMLANVQHESGFNPSASGDGGTALGFFQHRQDRADKFKEIIGVSPNKATPEQAVKFFVHELNNPEEAGMTADQVKEILSASSAAEAAMLIQKYYERPKTVDRARGATAGLIYRSLYG